MLRLEAVEPVTFALLKRLQHLPVLSNTRLVGGTALALQLGHRTSVDLDIFGSWDYSVDLRSVFSDANPALALRSLAYFDDAEAMPMPKMLIEFDWEAAKRKIQSAVRQLVLDVL